MTSDRIVHIVDDDAAIRRAMGRLLRSAGFETAAYETAQAVLNVAPSLSSGCKSYGFPVETFVSAEDFLASGRLSETACLVLDVQMPGLNGLELQSRLIADGHQIPIIFITAFHDEKAREQALQAGRSAILSNRSRRPTSSTASIFRYNGRRPPRAHLARFAS